MAHRKAKLLPVMARRDERQSLTDVLSSGIVTPSQEYA